MSREKLPRPASLTEALDHLKKAKATFDNLADNAIKEAETGNLPRAEILVKEGHTALLAMKDSYNRAYGQIQSAARTEKAKNEPKEDKKERKNRAQEPKVDTAKGDEDV